MPFHRTTSAVLLSWAVALLAASTGCNTNPGDQRARDERTRDEVAKATERAKPALEQAGHELDEAAHDAAGQIKATAQGVRDGLKDNSEHSTVDVNSASEPQLLTLPGIGKPEARKIIDNRPYTEKRDLLDKGVLSASAYGKIRDQITVN